MEWGAVLSIRHKAVMLLGIAFVTLCVCAVIYASRGWYHLRELQDAQAQLEATVVRLELENSRLEEHLRRLEQDDAYLEKVVRERLGWVKDNEMIYRLSGVGVAAGAEKSTAVGR